MLTLNHVYLKVDDLGELVINKEKTTHLSIHTVHLDGLRELYRHFLVAPDGAIHEVGHAFATSKISLWKLYMFC